MRREALNVENTLDSSPGDTQSWDFFLFFFPDLHLSILNFQASYLVLVVKNLSTSTGDARDVGSSPGSGRSSRGGHGNPLYYSCLENPQGQRRLEEYSPQGCRELDMTEATWHAHS